MNKKQCLPNLSKTIKNQTDMHYTLTPDHLYIHNKKRLHKSKIIWRFDNELNLEISDDSGKTWSIRFENGNILCDISKLKFKRQEDSVSEL